MCYYVVSRVGKGETPVPALFVFPAVFRSSGHALSSRLARRLGPRLRVNSASSQVTWNSESSLRFWIQARQAQPEKQNGLAQCPRPIRSLKSEIPTPVLVRVAAAKRRCQDRAFLVRKCGDISCVAGTHRA